jgi:hypothetical protein
MRIAYLSGVAGAALESGILEAMGGVLNKTEQAGIEQDHAKSL